MQDFTTSWLRAYHTGIDPGVDLPPQLDLVDLEDQRVYDVQTLRRRHVVQAKRPAIPLTIPCGAGAPLIHALAHPFLLFHVSGFVVVRLTLVAGDAEASFALTPDLLRGLHRRLWQDDEDIEVSLPSGRSRANVRSILNHVLLEAFDEIRGLPPELADLASSAREGRSGFDCFHQLHARGLTAFPYPVIAGTHYEMCTSGSARISAVPDEAWIGRLMSLPGERMRTVRDLAGGSEDLSWYASEMQSAVVLDRPDEGDHLVALQPQRMQLAEFFALRRGALRSVQRETQLILAEGRSISTKRLGEWRRIVATLSDDYVLHDDTGPLVKTLTEHFREDEHVRDPEPLRQQVSRNIDAFQHRVDVAGQRAGVVLGVLFGVVAALSLSPIAKQLLAIALGLSPSTADRFAARYPWWSVVVDLAIVVALGAIALALFRRASGRLPSARRPARTGPRDAPG